MRGGFLAATLHHQPAGVSIHKHLPESWQARTERAADPAIPRDLHLKMACESYGFPEEFAAVRRGADGRLARGKGTPISGVNFDVLQRRENQSPILVEFHDDAIGVIPPKR